MSSPTWSYERLLSLAPDAGTLDQARRLFFANRWRTLEGNGHWLWGEYETAYGDVFQAAVRLDPPLFRCSCKGRRRPCKHSLALVLLFLNRNDVWKVQSQVPEWAQRILGQQETAPASSTKPSDDNQDKRLELMEQGVAELEKWLLTLTRTGLAQASSVPEEWENMASRMVDAKLGSIARRIRWCQYQLTQPDWINAVAAELGSLYLFVRAWQRKTTLAPAQKRELLQVAGWAIRKEQVLQQLPVTDNWLVLGITTGTEDKLTYRRTWLRGERTQRFALILDFAFGKAGFEDHWVGGSVLNGTLSYYPGQPALRAIFRQYQGSEAPYQLEGALPHLAAAQGSYAHALGLSPWVNAFPLLLDSVAIQYDAASARFLLTDEDHHAVNVPDTPSAWKLLALSGGLPTTVFGEYDGRTFTPITALDAGRVVVL